jgi:hypothetical protein
MLAGVLLRATIGDVSERSLLVIVLSDAEPLKFIAKPLMDLDIDSPTLLFAPRVPLEKDEDALANTKAALSPAARERIELLRTLVQDESV